MRFSLLLVLFLSALVAYSAAQDEDMVVEDVMEDDILEEEIELPLDPNSLHVTVVQQVEDCPIQVQEGDK